MLENIKPVVAVDQVNQSSVINEYIITLGKRMAGHWLGHVIPDLLGMMRVGNINDAKPAGEPRGVHEIVLAHAFVRLMRAEPFPLLAVASAVIATFRDFKR